MHKPVLLNEVLQLSQLGDGSAVIWDATFGRGGHTREIFNKFPQATVVATDRDPEALAYGKEAFAEEIRTDRLKLLHLNFHDIEDLHPFQALGLNGFDFVLMDLGVSSPQLDDPARGFSFYHEGPLDMRMDPSHGQPAHEIINSWTEVGLQRLFSELGEVPRPHRVVKQILAQRREKPFSQTIELAQLIERVEGWRKRGRHPATQYFLALRLLVNDEINGLKASLPLILERALKPGGRMAVITFHSLEDRIVKTIFKDRKDLGTPVNKKVIIPSRTEILDNPRARSAKLRVFQAEG